MLTEIKMYLRRLFAASQTEPTVPIDIEIQTIDEVLCNGQLLILSDGSRWEVDKSDAGTSRCWSQGDAVAVVDDRIYLLEEPTDRVVIHDNQAFDLDSQSVVSATEAL